MIILKNARIFGSINFPDSSESLAIQNGTILAVGNNEDVHSIANRDTQIIDLQGKTILPGLTDSHLHLQHLAKSLQMVNCETENIQDCFDRLVEKAKNTPPNHWIFGHGWNQNQWEHGFKDLERLHQVSENHPIFLTAKSLHAAWANKSAFNLAGITKDTENPIDGVIDKDENGYPTGLLFENAMSLLDDIKPNLIGKALEDSLLLTQKELWKVGITSVHDFDGADCFSALQYLDQEDKWRIRTQKSIPLNNMEAAIKTGLRTGFGSDFLRIGPVKLFADGALGPQTAAMLDPYENNPGNIGILMLTQEEILHYGKMATQNGLSLAIHAIGDKANREVIDAYAQLRIFEQESHISMRNHRIEHVQILSYPDLKRLSENNIIASMQPIHLISDMDTADKLWGKRSQFAYAFNSLLNNHTHLIFGSDAPVESFNPFLGMYAALTRNKIEQPDLSGWYTNEKISLQDIIEAYTIKPAMSSRWNDKMGQLKAGNYADLIVLPENPFDISPGELKDILPLATMVAGQWVWQNGEF